MTPARCRPEPADTLGRRDFDRIAAFVKQVAGIRLPETKRTMLEGRLRRRMRATGQRDLAGYCEWLFAGDTLTREGLHLLNAVTTNKTDFFREPRHFDFLTGTLLPALVASGRRRVRAWSAACSTGAEPYTLAMLLDSFGDGALDYGILATDIDTDVLEVARRGVYPVDMVRPVPPALRARYVQASRTPGRREVRMAPGLRAAIGYARLNLMDRRYPIGPPMDLIFCRNVLIYFDRATQEAVVGRLVDCLAPGGHLFLGHSETIAGMTLPLRAVANTVFQRV